MLGAASRDKMANSSSIIKINKTEYWLPEELWREVKDFMGLCKKKDNVQWDYIKKAKLQDVLKLKLPKYRIQYELNLRPAIEINSKGIVSLKKYTNGIRSKELQTPKEVYFKSLKGIYMNKRMMTPAKWVELSRLMTKNISGWELCKEGDKFIYECHRVIGVGEQLYGAALLLSLVEGAEHKIMEKKKTVIKIKFMGYNGYINFSDSNLPPPRPFIIKLKKGEFNSLNIYNDTVVY
tara:strand:- start:195 stop:902 length:708 start_codon:yes stop_codon:yes gene_type:complete